MTSEATHAPRILLVDDTPANLIALGAVLEPLGAQLVEARSGGEALDRLKMGSFALALLDVQMPVMDGFETAARMRATDTGRELPIIFLTAIHRDETYTKKGYSSGAADYITKPFDADVLRARVKAFVDLFRQREQLRAHDVALRTRERDEAVRRLMALERIATAALEEGDVDTFLRKLLGVFFEAADSVDSAAVMLRERDLLRVRASVGNTAPAVGATMTLGQNFAGAVAASGEPLMVNDDLAKALQDDAMPNGPVVRALFGVPLRENGEVIGVAQIGSTRASGFPDGEKRLVIAMAERAAWAVTQRLALGQFHTALNAAPAIVSILGVPGYRTEFANVACRELFGERTILGATVFDLEGSDQLRAPLDQVLTTGQPVTLDERHVRIPPGSTGREEERVFNTALQPIRNPSGHVRAILSFAVDVTQPVRARIALKEAAEQRATLLESERSARLSAELASRAKDEFLATVSHELRTPLNAILGWAQIAQRKAPPEIQRALRTIERNARTQTRIIEDVLDLSRISSGKLRLVIGPTDVASAIAHALDSVRPTAEDKGVTLAATVGAVGVLDADPDRLEQVIWNLLSNAIKFTPPGGRVDLDAQLEGTQLVVRIVDTGQGIAPEFLPHLFEPFRQADSSTTRRHGGLGLGLAIVKELVVAHRGTVVPESRGLNQGSCFTLRFPVAAKPVRGTGSAIIAPSMPPSGWARLDGVRVLVVDDDEDARQLLQHVLTECGARVTCASSAVQALEQLADVAPNVIVSDLGMADVNGFELIERIRRLPPEHGGQIPAIALTAYAREHDRALSRAAGFQLHMAKPVDTASLVAGIASIAGTEPNLTPVGAVA